MAATKEALHQNVTPYLCVNGAAKALDFYARAFKAEDVYLLAEHNGEIGHAEFEIANSRLMISDEYPDFGALIPQTTGGSPVSIHVRVDDVDGFVKTTVAAGATVLRALKDQSF